MSAATWRARQQERSRLRRVMTAIQEGRWVDGQGRAWRFRPDLREPEHAEDPVQVGDRVWPDLESALEAEV